MNSGFQLFPDAASTAAGLVDRLYLFMVGLSTVMTILVAALVIYFAIKYRSHKHRKYSIEDEKQEPTSVLMELSWIGLSLPVLMFIFVWGANVCFFLFRAPANTMPVTVVAKQWMWKFQHANGRREIDTLHIPINQPIQLTMVSQDVIHSFFVPAFRVKQDVLPGRYTSIWFEATKPGDYRLYCAEYCGTNHSRMVGRIIAQTPNDFSAWLSGRGANDEPPEVTGEKLFEQFQCRACHRPTGIPPRGPPLEGIFRKPVRLVTGQTVIADDAYLRESILRPAAKVVPGFQAIMPTYEGQISEEGIMQLIAYIKSLSNEKLNNEKTNSGKQGESP